MKTLLTLIALTLFASLSFAEAVTLSWQDNSDNEGGFRIERKTADTPFEVIGTVGIDIQSFEDLGIEFGVEYFYRVNAFNTFGVSGYTNITAHIAVNTGVPNDPSNSSAVQNIPDAKLIIEPQEDGSIKVTAVLK